MDSVRLGDIRLTYLPDGAIHGELRSLYRDLPETGLEGSNELLDEDDLLVMSVGAVLVEVGERRALIDLGWGPSSLDIHEASQGARRGHAHGGTLVASLRECGLGPEDIDTVALSHLHSDHIGWLLSGDKLTFSRATHLLAEAEWCYWNEPGRLDKLGSPSSEQGATLASRLQFIDDGDTVVPGVDAMLTAGHTPGHLSFVASSGTARAVVLGDAVHCPLELSYPELELVIDVDPTMAARSRHRLERLLSGEGTMSAGGHFSGAAFQRLIVSDVGKRLVPVRTDRRPSPSAELLGLGDLWPTRPGPQCS
jgi:glyoxylase-like metal-dependent hydrolase (beta-lactamase superfamily II)